MNSHIKRQVLICTELAKVAHAGQLRRGGAPYYEAHIEKVARQFDANKGEWKEHCVALLHDVLEDSSTTERDLLNLSIDQEVVAAVVALTKERGGDYISYIKNTVKPNKLAKCVKIADIFANISDSPTKKQKAKYLKALSILC